MKSGIKRGDELSPTLFNIEMDEVIKQQMAEYSRMSYFDDVAILSKTEKGTRQREQDSQKDRTPNHLQQDKDTEHRKEQTVSEGTARNVNELKFRENI